MHAYSYGSPTGFYVLTLKYECIEWNGDCAPRIIYLPIGQEPKKAVLVVGEHLGEAPR